MPSLKWNFIKADLFSLIYFIFEIQRNVWISQFYEDSSHFTVWYLIIKQRKKTGWGSWPNFRDCIDVKISVLSKKKTLGQENKPRKFHKWSWRYGSVVKTKFSSSEDQRSIPNTPISQLKTICKGEELIPLPSHWHQDGWVRTPPCTPPQHSHTQLKIIK